MYVAKSLAVIGVTEQHDRVDEVGLSLRDQPRSIVGDLSPLAVPGDTQLRLRTLRHRLGDQRRHVLASGGAASSEETLDVGGVVVDPLDGYLSFAEHAHESVDEGGPDESADVAAFGRAAGEDEGQVLADAVDQVVVCCAVGDSEAGSWSHGGREAGKAAVARMSIYISEDWSGLSNEAQGSQ